MNELDTQLLLATLRRLDESVNRLNSTVSDLRQRLSAIETEHADSVRSDLDARSDRAETQMRMLVFTTLAGGVLGGIAVYGLQILFPH